MIVCTHGHKQTFNAHIARPTIRGSIPYSSSSSRSSKKVQASSSPFGVVLVNKGRAVLPSREVFVPNDVSEERNVVP